MDKRSKAISHRFKESWQDTIQFYKNLIDLRTFDHLIPLKEFIEILFVQGEWRYFRIGTSVHTLLFSRSVDFGLRVDQKFIRIVTFDLNDYLVEFRDGEQLYRSYRISDLQDAHLSKLLKTLKSTLVD